MEIDEQKIDEAALALFQLTLHDDCRAWKQLDWGVMQRLYDKGLIENPASKSKSVVLTETGLAQSAAQFRKLFTKP